MQSLLSPTPHTLPICPEHVTVRFCGVNFNLLELDDAEFNNLYDRVLDDGNDKQLMAENWTASQWILNKDWYRKWHAQHFYNLELFEVDEKRRKQAALVVVAGVGA